jgi:hypothetical protein
VVAEKNINSAVVKNKIYIKKEGKILVELDQFKVTLNSYTEGLKEVRDSL